MLSKRNRRSDEDPVGSIAPAGRRRGLTAPRPVTDVDQPDSVHVVPHATPLQLSSAVDWQLEMAHWVDEMAARNAIDGGTYYVGDELIRTRLLAELSLVDAEARRAHVTNSMLAGIDQENLQRAQVQLAHLRERDAELRARIADHTAQLSGAPPAAQPTPAADHTAALALRTLPPAPELTALLPTDLRTAGPATASGTTTEEDR